MPRAALEHATGRLFESLWAPYDQKPFDDSVELFTRRLDLIDFDRNFFLGKTVLDAGCGGGRNAIAMARLGAADAQGIDIGLEGILNARERAAGMDNVHFQPASILDIPFEDAHFDLVWCAGVLMITDDEDRALDELTRVLKPGGLLYLLVYADEGMRWPLINTLRPIARQLGQDAVKQTMNESRMPANKQRTFLDDLFCPKLDFYNWDRLRRMLEKRGYQRIERWGAQARLDHEHGLSDYREDLEHLAAMFARGAGDGRELADLYAQGCTMVRAVIDTIRWFESQVAERRIGEAEAMQIVIGQGHHRVLAVKSEVE
jgi:ubiquinone/menaquinone biosynthesis C-methylase UbiE